MDTDLFQETARLARAYAASSLYGSLHANMTDLIAEANARDAKDPNEGMKLRWVVGAYQRIITAPFLIDLARRALVVKRQHDAATKPAP